MGEQANPQFVVVATFFLWVVCVCSIIWSLALFTYIGDMLVLSGTASVNAVVLLAGILMIPINMHFLNHISKGKKIEHNSLVLGCPAWLSLVCVEIVNVIGMVMCVVRVLTYQGFVVQTIKQSMQKYRSSPMHKYFIDTIQWTFGCCGLTSFRDWFSNDWYDEARSYEWDPLTLDNSSMRISDSVPLSCCKTGTCISNYLTELGTHSIHKKGCAKLLRRVVIISMGIHFCIFTLLAIVQLMFLKTILAPAKKSCCEYEPQEQPDECVPATNVQQLMSMRDGFHASSGSVRLNPDDTDDFADY